MTFFYQGVEVEYHFIGNPGPCPTLILHGWGCDGEEFASTVENFSDRYFLTLDFPPFGKSGKVDAEWNIYTYASMVISLCEHLKVKKCDILAHSFGGRVGILMAALAPEFVGSLVLVDSAGLLPRFSFKRYLKIKEFKLKKKLGLNVQGYGSEDYQNLDEATRKVFVSIVSEDLKGYCHLISAKTLIVFGEKDKDTPPYMAKKLHRLIKNSTLVLLKEGGHFSFLDCPLSFCKALHNFWEGEK